MWLEEENAYRKSQSGRLDRRGVGSAKLGRLFFLRWRRGLGRIWAKTGHLNIIDPTHPTISSPHVLVPSAARNAVFVTSLLFPLLLYYSWATFLGGDFLVLWLTRAVTIQGPKNCDDNWNISNHKTSLPKSIEYQAVPDRVLFMGL